MDKFKFTPESGFRDGTAYPNPTSEANTREMFQRPLDQLRDYVNQLLGIIPTDEELQQMVVNHDAIQKLREDLEYLEEHSNSYAEYDENTGNLQINTVKEVNVTLAGLNELTTQLKNSITQLSNPNLLINSDFRNPVNQRNKTTYTYNGTKIYTIDRWALSGSANGKLEVGTNGVKLTKTGGSYLTLVQTFEKPFISEKGFTISCEVSNNVSLVIGTSPITVFDLVAGVNTFHIGANASFDNIYFYMEANTSIDIKWIKLEQGSIATPFVPRLIGEEFAMCKRYYQIVETQGAFGYEYGNTNAYSYMISFDFDEMRIAPTAEKAVYGYNNSSGVYISNEGIYSLINKYTTKYVFRSKNFNARPTNYCYFCDIKAWLDAEIY